MQFLCSARLAPATCRLQRKHSSLHQNINKYRRVCYLVCSSKSWTRCFVLSHFRHAELQAIVETRAKLEAQHSENESVDKVSTAFNSATVSLSTKTLQQEFGLLTPNNTVYKLIGTALVKQDQVEAKANVKKRLEFIQGEM